MSPADLAADLERLAKEHPHARFIKPQNDGGEMQFERVPIRRIHQLLVSAYKSGALNSPKLADVRARIDRASDVNTVERVVWELGCWGGIKRMADALKAIDKAEPLASKDPPGKPDPFESPTEFVDPSNNRRYPFGRKKVLLQLWRVLWTAKKRLEYDDLMESVPTWRERWRDGSMDNATVYSQVKNLRSFWRKNRRQDFAKRIRFEGGACWLEKKCEPSRNPSPIPSLSMP